MSKSGERRRDGVTVVVVVAGAAVVFGFLLLLLVVVVEVAALDGWVGECDCVCAGAGGKSMITQRKARHNVQEAVTDVNDTTSKGGAEYGGHHALPAERRPSVFEPPVLPRIELARAPRGRAEHDLAHRACSRAQVSSRAHRGRERDGRDDARRWCGEEPEVYLVGARVATAVLETPKRRASSVVVELLTLVRAIDTLQLARKQRRRRERSLACAHRDVLDVRVECQPQAQANGASKDTVTPARQGCWTPVVAIGAWDGAVGRAAALPLPPAVARHDLNCRENLINRGRHLEGR